MKALIIAGLIASGLSACTTDVHKVCKEQTRVSYETCVCELTK